MPRRRLLIPLWLLLSAAAVWVGFLRAPLDTDMAAFLPPSGFDDRLLEQVRSGPASRTLIVLLGGAAPEALARAGDQLVAALLADPRFEWAGNGAALPPDDPLLFRYRYLLSPALDAPQHLQAPWLRRELEQRLDELASPFGMVTKPWLAADPTGEYRRVLGQLARPEGLNSVAGRWASGDGRALLLIRTRAGALDLDAQQAALAALGAAVGRVDHRLEWQAVGPGVFAVESREVIRGETRALTLAATLLVALLLRLGYRSWTPMWAAAVPVATAVAAGAAATALLFGTVHGITVAFGATLIGVSLDYPVHLFSHQRGGRSLQQAAWTIGRTLGLGALTTVLGYLSLTWAGVAGLAQLGIFAAAGLAAAAVTTRLVLPGLLAKGCDANPRLPVRPWQLPAPLRRGVIAVAVTLAAAPLVVPPTWQDDPAALSPVPRHLLALERSVRSALGAAEPGSALYVHGEDAQAVLERSEALRPRLEQLVADGQLAGFRLISDRIPSVRTQLARQAQLPSDPALRQILVEATVGLPFRADLFEPYLEAVAVARTLAPLTPAEVADHPLLAGEAGRLQQHTAWSAQVPLIGIADREALRRAVAEMEGVDWVDLRQAARASAEASRIAAIEALGAGLMVIALALIAGLGSLPLALRVLMPVGLALGTVLGVFALLSLPLTLFHLITLVLVAGIAIDYTLFFLRHGSTEEGATAHAVLLSAVSTIGVFGILATSEIPLLQAIGATAALGVAAALLLTLALARRPDPWTH